MWAVLTQVPEIVKATSSWSYLSASHDVAIRIYARISQGAGLGFGHGYMPSYFRFQEQIWGFPRSALGSQPTLRALQYLCVCLHVCARGRGQTSSSWPPHPHRFFEDLERRHKAQVCVEDISDILEEHAEHHFPPLHLLLLLTRSTSSVPCSGWRERPSAGWGGGSRRSRPLSSLLTAQLLGLPSDSRFWTSHTARCSETSVSVAETAMPPSGRPCGQSSSGGVRGSAHDFLPDPAHAERSPGCPS